MIYLLSIIDMAFTSNAKNMGKCPAQVQRLVDQLTERVYKRTNTGYYKIIFVYGSKRQTIRYIPSSEGHKCYFKVCDNKNCPAFKHNAMHPVWMKGCCSGWNPCTKSRCMVQTKHLYGAHKRCIGNNGRQALPSWAGFCMVDNIPAGEIVYHFDREDFIKKTLSN
jgi:hypothetical protein